MITIGAVRLFDLVLNAIITADSTIIGSSQPRIGNLRRGIPVAAAVCGRFALSPAPCFVRGCFPVFCFLLNLRLFPRLFQNSEPPPRCLRSTIQDEMSLGVGVNHYYVTMALPSYARLMNCPDIPPRSGLLDLANEG